MKELKSIYTWSKENRAILLEWTKDAPGAPRVLSEAVKKFIATAPAPALYSLFESLKKDVNGAEDAADVVNLDAALDAIDATPTDDWEPICNAADNLGYDPLFVADMLSRGRWVWIDGINNYSDLGKWYVDEFIDVTDTDVNFLLFYLDYEWLGRDVAQQEEIYLINTTGKALHMLEF